MVYQIFLPKNAFRQNQLFNLKNRQWIGNSYWKQFNILFHIYKSGLVNILPLLRKHFPLRHVEVENGVREHVYSDVRDSYIDKYLVLRILQESA